VDSSRSASMNPVPGTCWPDELRRRLRVRSAGPGEDRARRVHASGYASG
jgi:hypothetical protein